MMMQNDIVPGIVELSIGLIALVAKFLIKGLLAIV